MLAVFVLKFSNGYLIFIPQFFS